MKFMVHSSQLTVNRNSFNTGKTGANVCNCEPLTLNCQLLSGQSIIEVLIAFGVIVVLGIALVSAGLLTQRTSISARNSTQATKLAQGYLEQVRVIRDVVGFTAFNSAYADDTCYKVGNASSSDPATWNLANCSGSASTGCTGTPSTQGEEVVFNKVCFYRKVTLDNSTTTNMDVNVTVVWREGVNDRIITANTVLSKWCEGTITGQAGSTCAL